MHAFIFGDKHIAVFPCVVLNAPIIYLNTYSNEGQKVFEAAQTAGCPPFTLVAISDLDWNRDMAPWDGPAAFKNGESFTGGADDYLRLLVEEIIPRAEKELVGPPAWRGIAGYSLAGLFALYAIYRTDVFSRVGCMSASLWFPGFKEYIFSHEPKRRPDCIYFSLGGQRGQDPQSSPENSSGKYRGDPDLLPEQRHRHGVPAESRKPLCPWARADGGGHPVATEQIGCGPQAFIL